LWEGNKETIIDAEVPELQEFVFANKILRSMKKHLH
jgi:phospholipid/cholesterol/gamma-HCH transport system ATP-binding protein